MIFIIENAVIAAFRPSPTRPYLPPEEGRRSLRRPDTSTRGWPSSWSKATPLCSPQPSKSHDWRIRVNVTISELTNYPKLHLVILWYSCKSFKSCFVPIWGLYFLNIYYFVTSWVSLRINTFPLIIKAYQFTWGYVVSITLFLKTNDLDSTNNWSARSACAALGFWQKQRWPQFWSDWSACAALGCWHKHKWPLFLIFFFFFSYLLKPNKGLS